MKLERGGPVKPQSQSVLERGYLFTGADMARDVVALIDRVTAPGYSILKTGIPTIDHDITIAPQTVTVLSARPSHGKSMLLKVFARNVLSGILAGGTASENDRVIYITLEETREKLASQIGGFPYSWRDINRGDIAPDKIPAARQSAIGLAKTLRHLLALEHPGLIEGRLAPPVTPSMVIRSVERAASEDGARPRAIFLDYLQLLNPDGGDRGREGRTETVTAAAHGAKQLAKAFDCPVIMAVQASRDADSQKIKIPTMAHLQWASALEQVADTVIGMWRPCVDSMDVVDIGDRQLTVTDQLMLTRVVKSRDDGAGGRFYALNVDPVSFRAYPVDPNYMGGPTVASRPAYLPPNPIAPPEDDPELW